MTAPWRISEVLRLHVDAKHEDVDDTGVISYGLRYYGAKGFAHDIKWVSRTMEPVAREAFRRIRELTESARALPKHLKTTPDTPFLYHDRPQVGLHHELTVTQKAAYLRRKVLKGRGQPASPKYLRVALREGLRPSDSPSLRGSCAEATRPSVVRPQLRESISR